MRSKNRTSGGSILPVVLMTGVAVTSAAAMVGCGDDPEPNGTSSSSSSSSGNAGAGGEASSSSSSSSSGQAGTGGTAGAGGSGGTAGSGGSGGGTPLICDKTAPSSLRGSAIGITPDDSRLVSVNRDVGTVTISSVEYMAGVPKLTKVAELSVGAKTSEPWQVALDGCGNRAYVVLREEQKVVEILGISTAAPTVGASVAVGSEPTGIVLSPNNKTLYVANWVNGTVSIIDTATMAVTGTVDLNATLAATGLLGTVTARAALAHPRSLAMTNDGDADDTDETIYATEWFAQRTGAETVTTADTNKKGLVYSINAANNMATTIDLPPIMDTQFPDHNGGATGCFPNQVGSITINGGFAYVSSTCASPKGPIGVFGAGVACTVANQATTCGMVGGMCNTTTMTCQPNNTDVKTTTHPALTVINLMTNTATETIALDKRFSDITSTRMPLLPTDIGFFNGTFGYLSSNGADAVFRLTVDANGALASVGSATNKFIDMRTDANDKVIRLPIGIATANNANNTVAFVANEGSRDITAVALGTQSIAGGTGDFRILQASALPAAGTPEEHILKGKRFFNTGLGRWSLNGEAWGSCAACHIDGLSDNVTWYFARGPRQSTSLDGSFASKDPTDQRIFNWTAIFDEVADFELNTRGVSGGKGAIVDMMDNRIDLAGQTPPQQGLQGSANDAADPMGASAHPHSVLSDWKEIAEYIKAIRSPRKPTNLVQADVDAGRTLFSVTGNCVGCHSGAKWTISKLFYTPGDIPNAATADTAATSLQNISWNTALNSFPTALFPVGGAANPMTQSRMRFGNPPAAEQLQCILRPVGTFGVAPTAVGVVEVRANMTTPAQGNGDTERGFNPPSLLGMQVGAPYFHAGNARTLEEVFDNMFQAHHQSAVAQVFTVDAAKRAQLVAFLLAIDESEPTLAIPAKGATGGDICFYQ